MTELYTGWQPYLLSLPPLPNRCGSFLSLIFSSMPETGSITLRILTLFLSEYSHHGTVKTIRAAARKVIPNMSRLKTVSTPERVVYSHEKRIKKDRQYHYQGMNLSHAYLPTTQTITLDASCFSSLICFPDSFSIQDM